MIGRVIKSTGSYYRVSDEKGRVFKCRLKGNIRLLDYKFTNPVAVGDYVEFGAVKTGDYLISEIQKRKNYVIRKAIKLSKQAHIIASNIDLAALMVTIDRPKTHSEFIDRYLVTAEAYHIPVVLIFNKMDLLTIKQRDSLNELAGIYEKIGYKNLYINALNDKSIKEVHAQFRGKTTLISGHSGVGKTTLINSLNSELKLKTEELSAYHRLGKHTTTNAEMFAIGGQGYVIDTPGIKGLGVLDIKTEEISHYFLEMRALLPKCRFNNCLHANEPDCAVKKALKAGELSASRYRSYMSLLKSDRLSYRIPDYE